MMDPLDAFRAAISAKYEIEPVNAAGVPAGSLRSATHLRFSTAITFPKSAPTRLRKVGSSAKDPASEPDGFFMLEAVYLAWSLRDTPGGEYMKQAREHGLPAGGFVGLTERKSIVDWLKRTVTALDSIVPLSGVVPLNFREYVRLIPSPMSSESTTPPGTPPPSLYRRLPAQPFSTPHTQSLPSTSTRSRGDAGPNASPPKRRYVPDAADVEVVKKIRQGEVELRDRSTVLRGIKNNVCRFSV
jgi:parafibromin